MVIQGTVTYINELLNVKKKLKKIEYYINYERYKLKKTELILAQNLPVFSTAKYITENYVNIKQIKSNIILAI